MFHRSRRVIDNSYVGSNVGSTATAVGESIIAKYIVNNGVESTVTGALSILVTL